MKAAYIYKGKVFHTRTTPLKHEFEYPVYFYAFNLDKLAEIAKNTPLFSYNKKNITSIFDSDYLNDDPDKTIKEKLFEYLKDKVNINLINSVYLVTSARYFNYVFNPVSFYYCFNIKNEILCIVAEVNNTFKERHLYFLTNSEESNKINNKFLKHYTVPKDFHVSPFYAMKGDYDFWFSSLSPKLEIRINVLQAGKPDFFAKQVAEAFELNGKTQLKIILSYPLTASLTMPRILYQAYKLKFIRRLKVYKRPYAKSTFTIKKANIKKRQILGINRVCDKLKKCSNGILTLEMPDGNKIKFGKPSNDFNAYIKVNDYDFFWKILKGGPVAFGETYTKNYWSSPNLTAVIEWSIANRANIENSRSNILEVISRIKNYFSHLLNNNSIKGSRKNISAHYDLSNDFFKLFLDESLSYSSAFFKSENEDLKSAQLNKIDRMLDKLKLNEHKHLLEIGTGWGALAIRATKKTGCKVTSVTISKEQYEFAKERVKKEGLTDKIHIKLLDFRKIKGNFDALISVEMLEAVGAKNYKPFFKMCEKVLKPNALMVLQVITIPDFRFKGLKKRCDWIQKYIFPGSLIPSLTALGNAASNASNFSFEELDNIGIHYAKTLKIWKETFNSKLKEVRELGFDSEFINMWNYYLSYCEAAFSSRTLGTHQILMSRPNNDELSISGIYPASEKVYKIE